MLHKTPEHQNHLMRGIEWVDTLSLLPKVEESRRHWFKVMGKKCNRNLKSNFFIQRLVGIWNKLLEKVVEAGVIATF